MSPCAGRWTMSGTTGPTGRNGRARTSSSSRGRGGRPWRTIMRASPVDWRPRARTSKKWRSTLDGPTGSSLSTALKLHRSKTSNYRFNLRFQPFRSRRSNFSIFFIIVSTHFQSLFALLKNKMKQLPTSVQVSFLIHLRLQNRRAVVPEPLQRSDTVHLNH